MLYGWGCHEERHSGDSLVLSDVHLYQLRKAKIQRRFNDYRIGLEDLGGTWNSLSF